MSFFVGEGVFELYRDVFGVLALVEQNACESYKLNQQFSFYFQKEVYFFLLYKKASKRGRMLYGIRNISVYYWPHDA